MLRYLMRFLLLSSMVILCSRCHTLYWQMKPVAGNAMMVMKLKPAFGLGKYKTTVEVAGRHLSGLLIVKQMPDSSIRVVFTNEIGFTFFDFEWPQQGGFIVHSVISQLNRKAVISTLQKDFEGILMNRLTSSATAVKTDGVLYYNVFRKKNDYYYYVTDSLYSSLNRIERTGKRKKVMIAKMDAAETHIPDSVLLHHHNFAFDIKLKKLDHDAKK